MDARVRRCLELIDQTEELAIARVSNLKSTLVGEVDSPKAKRSDKMTNVLLGMLRELFVEPSTQAIRVSALTTFCYHNGIDLVTYSYKLKKKAAFTLRSNELVLDVKSSKQ